MFLRKFHLTALLLAFSVQVAVSAADSGGEKGEMRIWTSAKGAKIHAFLVQDLGRAVVLENAQGKQSTIRLSALSREDQLHIRDLRKKRQEEERANPAIGAARRLQSGKFPDWAKPEKNEIDINRPWLAFDGGKLGRDYMKANVPKLRWIVENNTESINHPYLTLELAQHLVNLDADPAAYQTLNQIISFPDDKLHNERIYGLGDLQAVKNRARFMLMRVLARNGIRDEALAVLKETGDKQTGYLRLCQAEVLALCDDDEKALAVLDKIRDGNGHPDEGFSYPSVFVRAGTLARVLGDDELTRVLVGPMLKAGKKAENEDQWRSAWETARILVQNAKEGPVPVFSVLKDGSYMGKSEGLVAPIEVSVSVRGGKVDEIRVMGRDSRPWSTFDVMPERIIGRQSLKVDAITGATISSCAVLAAVDQALLKAVPKEEPVVVEEEWEEYEEEAEEGEKESE